MAVPKANRAIKCRIYPTEEQLVLIVKTFGCCRYYWNAIKEDSEYIHDIYGVWWRPSYSDYKKYLPECAFLKEVDSSALANVKLNYERALKNHFENPKQFGLPTYHKREGLKGSYTTNVINNNIRFENGMLRLPKLGYIKIRVHRKIPKKAILKHVTVSRDAYGNFFASLAFYDLRYDRTLLKPRKNSLSKPLKAIGLDYSSPKFFVSDKGISPEICHAYLKSEKRLARLQKKLARAVNGSHNYKKLQARIAKVHTHIACQRNDFLHKLSTAIANDVDIVCVEDLNLKGMSNHGFGLGKHTLDNGYGKFLNYLSYKLLDRDKYLVKVGRYYPSSKTCHHCGTVNHDLKLSDRDWECPSCHHVIDRDVNAALNILDEGLCLLLFDDVNGGFNSVSCSGIVDCFDRPIGESVVTHVEKCKSMTVLPACEGFSGSLYDSVVIASSVKHEINSL